MVSWLVSKETLVSEALRVLSCTGVGTLLPPGLAWSGGGKEGAMVQDPRPLEQGGGAKNEVKERTGDCRQSTNTVERPLSDLQLVSASPLGTKPSGTQTQNLWQCSQLMPAS
ncbi:hypothetical protein EMCRGX_G009341 [Ephydatia muelleri]